MTTVCLCGTIFAVIRWLFNQLAKRHPYRTEWVEDLPERVARDTVYIIGGKKYPFQAAVVCPRRRCRQIIHLDISPELQKRWLITEHPGGEVSLHPSVHVTGRSCKCHYWLQRGRIRWSGTPSIFVPRENRDDS